MADQTTRYLRVASWNLWARYGDWRRRQDAIISVLSDLAVDICGLQEVWEADDDNQARLIADALGYHWAWTPSGQTSDGVTIGNAVISRWPIQRQETLVLPAARAVAEGRTALFTKIRVGTDDVPFFTTHLNSSLSQSAARLAQTVALANFVNTNLEPDDYPPIVTGDFNAEPDSDEIRLFAGQKTAPAVPDLSFYDAWAFADPATEGWTCHRRNPANLRIGQHNARIDYIFVGAGALGTPAAWRQPITSRRGHIHNTWLAGNGPVPPDIWPSDHAAVVTDLHLCDGE